MPSTYVYILFASGLVLVEFEAVGRKFRRTFCSIACSTYWLHIVWACSIITKPSSHYVLTEFTISGLWQSNGTRPSPTFLHSCEVKSGGDLHGSEVTKNMTPKVKYWQGLFLPFCLAITAVQQVGTCAEVLLKCSSESVICFFWAFFLAAPYALRRALQQVPSCWTAVMGK